MALGVTVQWAYLYEGGKALESAFYVLALAFGSYPTC